MKKITNLFSVLLLTTISCVLASCDLLNDLLGGNGSNNNEEHFDSELESSTGKWLLQDDTDTYFTFDGSKNVTITTTVNAISTEDINAICSQVILNSEDVDL